MSLRKRVITSILLPLLCSPVIQAGDQIEMEQMKKLLGFSEEQARAVVDKREGYAIEFSNLPIHQKNSYDLSMRQAWLHLRDEKMTKAYYHLTSAYSIFDKSRKVNNYLSAVYMELRLFPEAIKTLESALKVEPLNSSLQYNLGEAHFALRQYQRARVQFSLVDQLNQGKRDEGIVQLSHFKRQLCLLGEIKKAKKDSLSDQSLLAEFEALNAKGRERNYDLLYYYSAVIEKFHKNDLTAAKKWQNDANFVFPKKSDHAAYLDGLIEYGFLASFYGGEKAVEK